MAPAPTVKAPFAFELKSTTLSLLALTLKTTDLALLADALQRQTADAPGLFEHEAVVLDLSQVQTAAGADDTDANADADAAANLAMTALIDLLRSHGMVPVGIKGGSAAQTSAALENGLVEAPDIAPARSARPMAAVAPVAMAEPAPESPPVEQPPPPAAPDDEAPTPGASEPIPTPSPAPPMVVTRPLRSGQQVYARGGDLVMLAAVNDGAEVIADGSIHVYAPLRGRAVAGARGDTQARIFATHMQPQLVSIAGTYLTIEADLAADVKAKPAQVRLDAGRLVFEPIGRGSV